MKPKTFKYNQIIQFFIENKLPLTKEQVSLIGSKVKEEIAQIEAYRTIQKKKSDAKILKRLKEKQKRENAKIPCA